MTLRMAREKIDVIDLGCNVAYDAALNTQLEFVERRKNNLCADTLLLLEHSAVYTLGRLADTTNILVSDSDLEKQKIAVFKTNRGGDVTYHGPGQLTGYLIFDIGAAPSRVAWFVHIIEEALIRTVAEFGITAVRDSRNRGIWVNNDKLAAIGLHVSKGITMHGFALNVNTDMKAYEGIVPCGLTNAGVTSVSRILNKRVDVDSVKLALKKAFDDTYR